MLVSSEQDDSSGAFRSRSGHRAIDAIRYRQPTLLETHGHASGLQLLRTCSYGTAGTLTAAERPTGEPDLMFVSRGSGLPACGKVAGRSFELKPNLAERVTYVPADADSIVEFGVAARSSTLIFPHGYLAGLMQAADHGSFVPLLFEADRHLMQLVRILEAELVSPGFASEIAVESLCRMIAIHVARLGIAGEQERADRMVITKVRLKRVMDHVEAHLGEPVGLPELAAIAGLSPFHFSRVFRNQTGSTPYQHVIRRRIARAKELLSDPAMPIGEVARACGFSSQSHFTAAFTRATGVSPAKFRARLH
jgi:AraC-like DNA-binding protein